MGFPIVSKNTVGQEYGTLGHQHTHAAGSFYTGQYYDPSGIAASGDPSPTMAQIWNDYHEHPFTHGHSGSSAVPAHYLMMCKKDV